MADPLRCASTQLSQFAAAILFFHGSEYVLAAAVHGRSNVTLSSLLISKQYVLAMTGAVLEYVVELLLFPEIKEQWIMSNVGLAMVLIGEVIRKIAILTAQQAFTHHIKIHHDEHHELVTSGIYRFIRHPVVTWRFFSSRIPYEEFFLRQFFGSQYEEYAARVPSGLPFIN